MFNQSKMEQYSDKSKYLVDYKSQTTAEEMTYGLPCTIIFVWHA